jgi:exodeoxyribonuclease V alpha subunit
MNSPHELVGVVERCLFKNAENGYVVFVLALNARESATVTGCFPDLHEGTRVSVRGEWSTHPKFGRQFVAAQCTVELPQSVQGIEKYLASGLIKGIGPAFAKRLVQHFGEKTLDIIDQAPFRLSEVRGVGEKRIEQIKEAWHDQKEISKVMVFLQEKDVSTAFAAKIYKRYGNESIAVVTENPYRLVDDIWGVGFKTADQVALKLGFSRECMPRIKAGIAYAITQAIGEGHLYKTVPTIEDDVVTLLELSKEQHSGLVKQGLRQLYEAGKLVVELHEEEHYATLSQYYHSEKGIAAKLAQFMKRRSDKDKFDLDAIYQKLRVAPEGRVHLNDEQQAGIMSCLQNKVTVITGGPGTGKTTLLKTLLDVLDEYRVRVKLAAPTGRAAKRMFEGTGRGTETLHRMLEFSPATMGFTRNEQNALQAEFVIVDEASMIDAFLMHSLIKALPDYAHLVLLGDVDQLPSVGAGCILHDLIESGVVPVTRLQHIFRQAQDSMIIVNAHRVNKGEFPSSKATSETSKRDFYLSIQDDPAILAGFLRKVYAATLKRHHISFDNTVVLTPMNRGIAGTATLNLVLQSIVNPPNAHKKKVARHGYEFIEGDRVMQIRNNYDKYTFNGDIGSIAEINPEKQEMTVRFGQRPVTYEFHELSELVLAYAISIHKSQGSEFDAVIIPLFMQHFMLLQRNLIYTAITRAKKLCIMVGQARAIAMGVKSKKGRKRITFLQKFLRAAVIEQK